LTPRGRERPGPHNLVVGDQTVIKLRLLAQTTLEYDENEDKLEKLADGEPNLWTDEMIYEVAVDGRSFVVRVWFEAQGHGEMDIDPTPDGQTEIEVHGFKTTVAGLVQAMCLLGWIADTAREWVEITEDHVKDANEQFAFPESR
jgi:hypothetical protein